MPNLVLPPDASLLAHAAANAVLALHIAGGGIGIGSGFAALAARKGGRAHRVLGTVFFWSMCTAYAIAAAVAPFLQSEQRVNFTAGVFALYLALTSWRAARRRMQAPDGWDRAGFMVALATALAGWTFMRLAAHDPSGTVDGSPPQSFYVFMALGTAATLDDAAFLLRRGYGPRARIARHLWRVCAALFFATGSLFFGQQQVFPAAWRDSAWLAVPVLLPVLLMLYYLARQAWPGLASGRGRFGTG
ncbi:MAG: hypothetical protein ACXU8N_19045 [Telluria sp.]